MVADRVERLRQLLHLLSILALCHCCVVHTSQHGAYQWQRIICSVLAAPTNQLLMYVTVITALVQFTGHIDRRGKNLVGVIAGAGEPSMADGISNAYMHWSAVTR